MNFPKFSHLALELQQQVMEQCETDDLARLARTSHDIYNLAFPLLYRHVDLSYHNTSGLFSSSDHYHMVESNSPDRDISDEEFIALKARQEYFVDTIIKNPKRGALVHSLAWTYHCSYEGWGYEDIGEPRMRFWKAFGLLGKVERLDFCSFMGEGNWLVPPPLFPNAKFIRIGGRMPYAIFRALISSPEKIISLELDNPQGFAQIRDEDEDEDDSRDGQGDLLNGPRNYVSLPETEDENHLPLVRHSGPMRGHLRPLIGQFTHLKHLSLHTVGQFHDSEPSWSEAREKARYSEIADFISSWLGRPMNTYFLSHILPCLIRGPWPELKALSVRGVGGQMMGPEILTQNGRERLGTPDDPAIFSAAEERLRVALGSEVALTWEKEAGRAFYLHPGSNYSDPNALS